VQFLVEKKRFHTAWTRSRHEALGDARSIALDLDPTEAIDALIAGKIDVAIFASQLDPSFSQRVRFVKKTRPK
jgi:DNA-binding transcriptional LysR family regulator